MTVPLLQIDGLNAWYDRSHVVQGLSFHINARNVVVLPAPLRPISVTISPALT